MEIPKIIKKKKVQLSRICGNHQVDRLYLFGSALTSRFSENESDLDFQVILGPMSPLRKGETLLNFWTSLEELFGRRVDLLTDKPIKNPILRRNINRTKILIYDRKGEKVSV